MKILPITLLNTHKQSFGEKDSRSDLNRQVKQIMRENFADMQNSIIENARKQINNEFTDKFEKEITFLYLFFCTAFCRMQSLLRPGKRCWSCRFRNGYHHHQHLIRYNCSPGRTELQSAWRYSLRYDAVFPDHRCVQRFRCRLWSDHNGQWYGLCHCFSDYKPSWRLCRKNLPNWRHFL